MPRKTDPAKIKVGHGLAASDSVEVNALIPGQGEPGAAGGGSGMVQHIQDEHDAHPASSVSVDDVPKIYDANNVEGVLDELAALVPPRPATIGNKLHYFEVTGIPDWGVLKLDDATWFVRSKDQLSEDSEWFSYFEKGTEKIDQDTGIEVYPYFWRSPRTATDFLPKGNDPASDKMFNVDSNDYVGGGAGEAHAGAFRTGFEDKVLGKDLVMSHEIIPSSGKFGGKEVVLSGVVFPADRGTLALVRLEQSGTFSPDTLDPNDFVKNKVLAAINLGQGIFDKCDGAPGGIFWLGDHGGECAPHSYDPFTFPGRATGQYDLRELHTGLYRKKDGSYPHGEVLPSPFDDFDGDGNQGAQAAGQVRLGTDPNSGIPVITDGIPIFGAGSMARGGGNDHNFFRYRLPYLVDYEQKNGIKWTPLEERHRFFDKPEIAFETDKELEFAGDYREFEKDYWTYQVGRYRHQFKLPEDLIDEHTARKCGHYILIHFKKEKYFEDYVRDHKLPTQEEIYSVNLLDWTKAYHPVNKAVLDESAKPVAASSYHVLRANVFEDYLGDKDSEFCHMPVPPIIDGAGQHDEAKVEAYLKDGVEISGVDYATHVSFSKGSVHLKEPNHEDGVYGLFETSFLTHDNVKNSGLDLGDNAFMGNMYPAFLSTMSFTGFADTTLIGAVQPFTDENRRRGRIHFGFAHLISEGDDLLPAPDYKAHLNWKKMSFKGDRERPKFTRDGVLRAFFRRPLNHGRDFLDYAKFFNTGIKLTNFVEDKPKKILFHGSRLSDEDNDLLWSNAISHPKAATLWGPHKDREEYFLDEAYRLRSDFRSYMGEPEADFPRIIVENLDGPGLPHGDQQVPALPYDYNSSLNGFFKSISWLGSKSNRASLAEPEQAKELQVAGWPDRNPPIEDGVTDSTQQCGVLIMPQHDYSQDYQPPGPDYSGLTDNQRSYVRVFHDVGEEGCSKVVLGINGISLNDIKFKPNNVLGSSKMAILIKVPGLTNWMDVGRRDGEGPSKQDPFSDGAGCMVLGPNTKDLSPRPQHGTKRCMVECNLGPSAALYKPLDPDTNRRTPCQLLMKVVIYPSGKNLNLEQGGPNGTVRDITGLIGVFVQGVK